MKNPKDCSVESKISKNLYLNFDEEGLVNIVYDDPEGTYILMSLDQWSKLINLVNEEPKSLEILLFEHFEARFEE